MYPPFYWNSWNSSCTKNTSLQIQPPPLNTLVSWHFSRNIPAIAERCISGYKFTVFFPAFILYEPTELKKNVVPWYWNTSATDVGKYSTRFSYHFRSHHCRCEKTEKRRMIKKCMTCICSVVCFGIKIDQGLGWMSMLDNCRKKQPSPFFPSFKFPEINIAVVL